jgi:hypothetical protein
MHLSGQLLIGQLRLATSDQHGLGSQVNQLIIVCGPLHSRHAFELVCKLKQRITETLLGCSQFLLDPLAQFQIATGNLYRQRGVDGPSGMVTGGQYFVRCSM